ncbi:MAG TPA: hypothetical protein VJ725_12735 [Thermoanaerobaculia bacterium]|nr:hypothetical protein [Thermoanaerobaculia bacterium]
MKRRIFVAVFALCLSLLGQSHPALAAEDKNQNDLYDQLIQEGWTVASPGVLQRSLGAGKVETLGFGEEGLQFKLETLRSQLAFLREEYRHHPSPEIRRSIRAQRTQIARVLEALDTAKAAEEIDFITAKAGIDCTIKYGAHVDAFPLGGGTQGVGANTDSYFNSNCGQTGEVYAHAYGKATGADNVIRTFSKSDPTTGPSLPRIGGNVTASATGTVAGVKDCYSYSYASMTSYDIGVTYEQSSTNYTCPLPMTTTISGLLSTAVLGYNCKTLTWTASATGGTGSYTYTWYRSGSQVGTGGSYSQTFCGDNFTWTEYVNLSLTARDTANQTAQDTHTTTINYSGSGSTCTTSGTRICPDLQ